MATGSALRRNLLVLAAKGRRTVKLTRDATEALRRHLTRQLEEIDGLGDYFQENGLVFCTSKGTLINPTNLRKRSFAPLLAKAGLPHMTFHQLRHTAATILLLKNVNPKIVSEMLGHASIAITLDTYSHVNGVVASGAKTGGFSFSSHC